MEFVCLKYEQKYQRLAHCHVKGDVLSGNTFIGQQTAVRTLIKSGRTQ